MEDEPKEQKPGLGGYALGPKGVEDVQSLARETGNESFQATEENREMREAGQDPETQRIINEVASLRESANFAEQQPSWDKALQSQRDYVEHMRMTATSLEQAANFLIRQKAQAEATTPEAVTTPQPEPASAEQLTPP